MFGLLKFSLTKTVLSIPKLNYPSIGKAIDDKHPKITTKLRGQVFLVTICYSNWRISLNKLLSSQTLFTVFNLSSLFFYINTYCYVYLLIMIHFQKVSFSILFFLYDTDFVIHVNGMQKKIKAIKTWQSFCILDSLFYSCKESTRGFWSVLYFCEWLSTFFKTHLFIGPLYIQTWKIV